MDFIFIIEKDLCIDCFNCEKACRARHVYARIRRGTSEHHIGIEVPQICKHCRTPVCVTGCPREAIEIVEGVVVISDRCIGCGKCARLCPYDSIFLCPVESKQSHIDSKPKKQKRRAVKCTLCKDFPDKACMEGCPTGALKRVSIKEYEAPRKSSRKMVLLLLLLFVPFLLLFTLGMTLHISDDPSNLIPHIFSITATGLFLVSLLYTVRKRTKYLSFGKLRHWLWAHIISSSAGFILIVFHVSGKVGFNEPTFALTLLLILVVTGIFYRFIYPQRPKPAILAEFSRQKLNDMIEVLKGIAPLEKAMREKSPGLMEDAAKNILTGEGSEVNIESPSPHSEPIPNPFRQILSRETSIDALSEEREYRLFEVSRLSTDAEYLSYWETILRKFDYISYFICKLHKWLAVTFVALLILHVILVFKTIKIF